MSAQTNLTPETAALTLIEHGLCLPQAETTWGYDVSTGLWHERGRLLTMDPWTFTPHIGRCHTFGFGTHLVWSRTNGAIYAMRLDAYHDALIL